MRGKFVEGRPLVVTARDVARVRADAIPDIGLQFTPGKFLDRIAGEAAKFGVGNRFAAVADEIEIGREQIVVAEIINRRDELAGREVAGSTEDNDDRRRRAAVFAETIQERVTR